MRTTHEPENRIPGGNLLVDHWKRVYLIGFGLDVDFTGLKIPERKNDFDRLIIVARGISPNRAYNACRKLFPCHPHPNGVKRATEGLNEREATKTYAIWVRDRHAADIENENMSADILRVGGGTYITLVERLLYEIRFYLETGSGHLDSDGTYTICAGSRNSAGETAYVHWSQRYGNLYISWYDATYCVHGMRARSVIF